MNPITVNIGHTVNMSILWLDQNGNPMQITPLTDSPSQWTNTNPSVGTLAAAPDGLTAVETAISAGTDTVSLTTVVGGQTFGATLGITVTGAPQVLTSVQIASTAT